jgi:tetrahydromethanopterin S-methyltransferase subunit H
VSAVVVNVTAADPTSAGYITVWPSGTTMQQTSNLNFQAGQNIPNLVVVPVGADGKIQLFNGSGGTVQLIADVTGYILGTPAPSAAPNAAASATPTPGATPLMLAPVPAQG